MPNDNTNKPVNSTSQACPGDKYWVRPHQRIIKDKNGKTRIEK